MRLDRRGERGTRVDLDDPVPPPCTAAQSGVALFRYEKPEVVVGLDVAPAR